MWIHHRHASVSDADFLAEVCNFLHCLVTFGFQADSRVDAVGSPTAGMGRSELSQRDYV
jgi:hypothetical protein